MGAEKLELVRREKGALEQTHSGVEEDATTLAQRSALELVEELVARAAEAGQRMAAATAIRAMIDALVENATRTGKSLRLSDRVRVESVSRIVSGWFSDGSLKSWADGIEKAIQVSSDPKKSSDPKRPGSEFPPAGATPGDS